MHPYLRELLNKMSEDASQSTISAEKDAEKGIPNRGFGELGCLPDFLL